METLILGGGTFVGRRMVEHLREAGHQVTVLNRGKTSTDLPPGVSRIIGDRTSTESMRQALEGTEYLFICQGPLIFFDDSRFTSYKGWEEVERMRAQPASTPDWATI